MARKQHLSTLIATVLLAGVTAAAAQPPGNDAASGFYGGVAIRDSGAESGGVSFGLAPAPWGRFGTTLAPDVSTRALAFGGYRWRNDVAVEASVEHHEGYTLRPGDGAGRGGVGLVLPGFADPATRNWNVDVYGSWAFHRALSLYGRLGYSQSETTPIYSTAVVANEARRLADGINYGVGLRYDLSRALGLKVEYARFGRLPGETVGGLLPESDQVQFGLQFRF